MTRTGLHLSTNRRKRRNTFTFSRTSGVSGDSETDSFFRQQRKFRYQVATKTDVNITSSSTTSLTTMSVSSWIRKRFDSAESDGQPIPESPEPVDNESENGSSSGRNSKSPNNLSMVCSFENETETRSKGVAKVKSQWQRAVRKLSANSSGYGSGSNDPSPSGSRISIEKPGWALKQGHYQPRSRHMSINVDQNSYSHYVPKSCAQPIPESRPVNHQRPKYQPSSLPPYAGHMPMSPPKFESSCSSESNQKSRTPSGSSSNGSTECSTEDEKLVEEFPYGPAFRAAMGRITAFPDGTEAVMIDSAMALEAFKIDQMVGKCFPIANYISVACILFP